MGRFDTTKATINANIKKNGNQEITGSILNSVMTEMVDATDAELAKLSENISQLLIKKIEGKYIGKDGAIEITSSSSAIYVFKVGKTPYLLTIPKAGNEYHCLYAFSDELVETGYLKNATGVGDKLSHSILLDSADVQYQYLYVSADYSGGDVSLFLKGIPELNIPANYITADMLQKYDLLPRVLTADNTDYNPYIAEVYINPQYTQDLIYRIRGYNGGFIVGAFGFNKYANSYVRQYACRLYEIKNDYGNYDVIPLVVDYLDGYNATDMVVGKTIGYILFKDIDGFTSVLDNTYGEILNSGLYTQSIFNPGIFTRLSLESNKEQTSNSLYNGVHIVIPDTIYAVDGDEMQIYWRSVVQAFNPYVFDIHAESSVGKSYPRYYTFKPTTDMVGKSYSIKIKVCGNDGIVIAKKDVKINVIAKINNPSSAKKILCIGASATEGGQWVGELKRRLVDVSGDETSANPIGLGLSNFSFVGRKNGSSNPVPLEATGGWKVKTYASMGERAIRFQVSGIDTLTIGASYKLDSNVFVIQEVNVTNGVGNIRCTLSTSYTAPSSAGTLTKVSGGGDAIIAYSSYTEETFSPFWNATTGKLDFTTYANDFCGGQIDVMVWHCGINDLASGGGMAETYDAFRSILRTYHEQFPNGKVVISSVPIGSVNGGFAANYGASETLSYWNFTRRTMEYAKALNELCAEQEFSSFVYYSPAMETFDAENGYPQKETPVNTRSSKKEMVGTNGVHPIKEGSYQIADAVYRTINAMNL